MIIVILANLHSTENPDSEHTPAVTMVINAYNEEAVIRTKLENTFALDYPRDLLEVLVISDESTDSTDEIVQEFADRGVRLLRQEPPRREIPRLDTLRSDGERRNSDLQRRQLHVRPGGGKRTRAAVLR